MWGTLEFLSVLDIGQHISNMCKIRHADICQKTCLHEKLHIFDIHVCLTYVYICAIPIRTQVYPKCVYDMIL